MLLIDYCFFFFKQKTAYEMRISDWSSDVCSSDLTAHRLTTLQKPGHERVPFFFIKVDPAGNVSKRLDGAGFPFARHGGGCPLWSVHQVFRRSEEHTSELQSLMRISYAVFCLKKKKQQSHTKAHITSNQQ